MRKLLTILSASCLLLTLGVVQAKATCYTIPPTPLYNGYTIAGQFCMDQNGLSFTGTATKAGQTYDIVAVGNITGQPPRVTLSGTITVSLPDGTIVKQVTINQTASTDWACIQAFLQKLLGALPQ